MVSCFYIKKRQDIPRPCPPQSTQPTWSRYTFFFAFNKLDSIFGWRWCGRVQTHTCARQANPFRSSFKLKIKALGEEGCCLLLSSHFVWSIDLEKKNYKYTGRTRERCGLWQNFLTKPFFFSCVLKWLKSPVCQYMAARYLIAKGERKERQTNKKKKKKRRALLGERRVSERCLSLSLSLHRLQNQPVFLFLFFYFLKFHLISSYRRRLRLPDNNKTHFSYICLLLFKKINKLMNFFHCILLASLAVVQIWKCSMKKKYIGSV